MGAVGPPFPLVAKEGTVMVFWLIGVRLHAMVQESEIPTWEENPAVFPVKNMNMLLTAAF